MKIKKCKQNNIKILENQISATNDNIIDTSKKRKRGIISIKSYISITIKKVIMLITILSQKTSISFGNFYASNW